MSQRYCVGIFQRGTQQENSVRNTPSLEVPLTATLGRVNKASFPVMVMCCF